MILHRKISLSAGLLYLLTFVSIPTLSMYGAVKSEGYLLTAGPDTLAVAGGVLEIIVALACIATAVVLFPVLKKQSETLAVGLIAARVLEAASIFAGVAFLLTLVSLRQDGVGVESLPVGHALVSLYDRIFLLSQSFMPAVNDVLLGLMLYQARLVPRALALIGIIGGPLLLCGYFAVMFNFVDQHAAPAAMSAILVALFEFSLAFWLIFKGFNAQAISDLESKKKNLSLVD